MPIKIKNSSKLTSEKRKKETKAGKEAYGTKAIKQDLKWIMKAYAFLENITTSTTINDVGLDGSTLRVLRGSRSVKDKVIKKWIEKEFNDHTTCEKNFKKRHSYIVGSLQEELLKK